MIPDFKISQNIGFYEFTNTRNVGLLNENREQAVPTIVASCFFAELILETIRSLIGPFIISSGFRCKSLNSWVGGAVTSKHMLGIAADLFRPEWDWKRVSEIGQKIYDDFARKDISAKIIIEGAKGEFWIHVNKDKELTLWEGVAGVYKKLF